ncbi:BatA domain-containing protein [Sphingomonas sanguinis]|uniref:BatA domain-containing protein n=1 Tax=Sphingomonas sanguinis TaxID=33051 RepID=UPI00301A6E6D
MPTLLAPMALVALAALALPLLIHLARRTEQRRTDFAALRWLRAKPRPRQRPRFEEWPLLIVRLLLLAMLALWLARPVTPAPPDLRPRLYVVPGIAATQAARWRTEDSDAHWLAPGFPSLDSPAPRAIVPVASLVRQLDSELPPGVSVRVLVPEVIEGADAQMPRLSRAVDWRMVPGRMPAPRPATPTPLALTIRAGQGRSDTRYLAAVAAAWQAPGRAIDVAALNAPLPDRGKPLAWLGSGAMPAELVAWVRAGGTAIVPSEMTAPPGPVVTAARDGQGRAFLQLTPLGKGRLFRFTMPLSPTRLPALLEPDFPDRLRSAIRPAPTPTRAYARDIAPDTGAPPGFRPTPLREWRDVIALIVGALFLLERWLATARRRWPGP